MVKFQSVLVAIAALGSVGCSAMDTRALPQFPALVDPASQEHHVGKVIFVELVTPDLAAARQFYAGLFGWTFRDLHKGRTQYVEASLDGHAIAGLVYREMPAAEPRRPAWLTFISVRDVDAAKGIAVKGGAKVLFEPHDIPARGREAVFADPQGAVFAVVASSSGDSPDVLARPGEWIWSSLITEQRGRRRRFLPDAIRLRGLRHARGPIGQAAFAAPRPTTTPARKRRSTYRPRTSPACILTGSTTCASTTRSQWLPRSLRSAVVCSLRRKLTAMAARSRW